MSNEGLSQDRTAEKASRGLASALRVATLATLAAGLLGTVGGPVADPAGTTAVAFVVAAPLGRVVFLAVKWFRDGDRRYSLAATALFAVVLAGAALAAIVR